MFEEYIAKVWICPQCGEVSDIRVKECKVVDYKRNELGVFEYIRSKGSMEVHCSECGAKCYRGD